ncbi:MAG: methylamine utilization protein [Gammaproteobacteria bacterium]
MPLQNSLARSTALLALIALAPALCVYADLSVTVTDASGKPVADAAVLLDNGQAATANTATTQIAQRNAEFTPATSIVSAGSTVHFPNFDRSRHHVYSFSKAKAFEIELYKGTPSDPIVFDQPGIVAIGCNVHDWMYGVVYVVDTANAAITNAKGVAVFENLEPGAYTLDVWHPQRSEFDASRSLQVEATKDLSVSTVLSLRKAAPRPQRPPPVKKREPEEDEYSW